MNKSATKSATKSKAKALSDIYRDTEKGPVKIRTRARANGNLVVYLDIYDKYFRKDRAGAIEAHNFILPILNHIRQNVEEIIYFEKKILMKRGIIATDVCRSPSFSTDEEFERLFEEYYAMAERRFNHA